MVRGELNTYPIQLLINYWEIAPSMMGARLNELLSQGLTHIAAFVPWQAVEADISHALPRFLQAAADRKMTVSLILSPEVGVHYANSGFPKDVFSKAENTAQHCHGRPVIVNFPPNAFALPSLFSPEFMKRYYNFLSRMDNLLSDLLRTNPHFLEGVNVVLTGSVWKYYRSPQLSVSKAFGGMGGDFSGSAALAYRQRLEQFYMQKEFSDPTPAASVRWKTQGLEQINRRWFYQQSEDVFRNRSAQLIGKKSMTTQSGQMEIFTPEVDPAFFYSHFLQIIAGGHASLSKLSYLVDESASRSSVVGEIPAQPFIHWTSLGAFRTLSDSEKQFLIIKSLLLMGGHGGGILMDEAEWFSLSHSFRLRAESLARSLSQGELRLRNRALYLSPHLWSSNGPLWDELVHRVGAGARLVSSIDLILRDREAGLLIVDPSFILTREVLLKLTAWATSGRILVLPRSHLYTESARLDLENLCSKTKKIDMDLGIPYQLHALAEGKLVLYEIPEGMSSGIASLTAWRTFLTSILSVSEIREICSFTDSRLKAIPLQKKGGGAGLFVLNGTGKSVAADIIFPGEVTVSDLAVSLSSPSGSMGGGSAASSRFSLEVPPCGVLPLSVDPVRVTRRSASLTDFQYRQEAPWS